MNRESILYAVIGVLVGSVLTLMVADIAVNDNYSGMMNMMGMHASSGSQQMMNSGSMMNNNQDMK